MVKKVSTRDVKPTLTWKTIYGYSIFGQGCRSPYLSFQAYYLLFFLTNVLEINAYLAATIYTITQWIKVITMLSAGVVIDSVPLKGGKFRPWLKYMSILLFCAFGLMWWNFGLGEVGNIVVFIILFTISMFAYNTMWVATRGLMGPMSKNSADSTMLAQGQSISASIIGVISGMSYIAILNWYAANFKQGYSLAGFTFAGIILVCMPMLQKITKPYDTKSGDGTSGGQAPEKITFSQMLKSMRGAMIPYFISHSLTSAKEGFFYALLAYFTNYVLNDPLIMGYATTLQSVGGFVGAMLIVWVEKTFGTKWGSIYGLFVQAGLYVLIAYFGDTAAGFLIIRTLISVVTSATGAFGVIHANDIADWNEMHGEVPARGFIQSLSGTTVRVGGVLGSMISSFGLASLGYVSGTVPTPEVLKGMVNLLAWGPTTVCILAGISFIFYNVDEIALNEWKEQKYANNN